MSDEKKLNKLKREKAFWRRVSSVLWTKTGIIDRKYVDKQLSEIERCHFTQTEIDKLNIGSYEQIEVKVEEVEK